jgi:hypothetical protein
MRITTRPTTYLTTTELQQLAAAKFAEAEALPNGREKQDILKSAHGFRSLAEMKGWLSSELRPPK